MIKHNILFLDFDWVINSEEYFNSDYFKQRKIDTQWQSFWVYKWWIYNFDDRLINNINTLTSKFDFKIVLSTSYRLWETIEWCKEICKQLWLTWECLWKTITLWHDLIHQDSLHPQKYATRWLEIQDYLDNHKDEINSYLILDDDNDLLSTQNFYQVNSLTWFTEQDYISLTSK